MNKLLIQNIVERVVALLWFIGVAIFPCEKEISFIAVFFLLLPCIVFFVHSWKLKTKGQEIFWEKTSVKALAVGWFLSAIIASGKGIIVGERRTDSSYCPYENITFPLILLPLLASSSYLILLLYGWWKERKRP